MFQNCAGCHRPGEVAPFSLLTFADVNKRAKQIQEVTQEPLHAAVEERGGARPVPRRAAAVGGADRADRQAGSSRARSKATPRTCRRSRKFPEGWKLGPPDIVLTMPEAYEVPAEGPDIYRNFVFDSDRSPGQVHQGRRVPAGQPPDRASRRAGDRRGRQGPPRGRSRSAAGFEGQPVDSRPPVARQPVGLDARPRSVPLPEGFRCPGSPGADWCCNCTCTPAASRRASNRRSASTSPTAAAAVDGRPAADRQARSTSRPARRSTARAMNSRCRSTWRCWACFRTCT